ncbi:MAG: hypothetical protein ABEH59_02780, partial [Halobacteriales archaeon]
MVDDSEVPEDLSARLDRLEATLEELREEVMGDDRVDAGRRTLEPAAETALKLTERLAMPAAIAALEANVRVLTFVQDRLRELEGREGEAREELTADPGQMSERLLDRLDDALGRMEDAIAESDLPQNAEARELFERARELNEDVRQRVADAEPSMDGDDVVTIDVEDELDQIRDDVESDEN